MTAEGAWRETKSKQEKLELALPRRSPAKKLPAATSPARRFGGGVAAREAAYLELTLERATSRQTADTLGQLSHAQLRNEVLVFANADVDADGVLTPLGRRLMGAAPWPAGASGTRESAALPLSERAVYRHPWSRPYAERGPASKL